MAIRFARPPRAPPLTSAMQKTVVASHAVQLSAVLRAPDLRGSVDLGFVLNRPDVRDTLLGTAEKAALEFPPGLSSREQKLLRARLEVVVWRMRLATRQDLFLTDTHVINRHALQNPRSAELSPERLKDAWTVSPTEAPLGKILHPRPIEPGSVRAVSVISYCSTDEQVAAFKDVLRTHDENFTRFGYRAGDSEKGADGARMTVIVSDDSPAPWNLQVKAAVEAFNAEARSGARFRYVGEAEKEEHFEQLLQRVLSSPRFTRLVAEGVVSENEVREACEALFSSGLQSGVVRNRNTAMLLGLQSTDTLEASELRGRVFQMDHDQSFHVLTENLQTYLRRRGLLQSGYAKPQHPLPSYPPVAVPIDTLGRFESDEAFRTGLGGASFTGGLDRDVTELVFDLPAPTEREFFGRSVLVEHGPQDDGTVVAHRVSESPDWEAESTIRSAVFVPDRTAPWMGGGRNQDLMLSDVNGGTPGDSHQTFVLHREVAGAKWGSRARLLRDHLDSQASGARFFSSGVGPGDGMKAAANASGEEADLEALGRAVLDKLKTAQPGSQSASYVSTARHVAQQFVVVSEKRLTELDGLLRSLEAGTTAEAADAAARWFFEKPFNDCRPSEQRQAQDPSLQSAAQERIRTGRAHLEQERSQMRALFHLDDPDGSERLTREAFEAGLRDVRSVAISWLFAHEIRGRPVQGPQPAEP
ncbi:MAG: hypothetical protein ACT4TC_16855 [Myxococcaceae bacterium]